jgi:CubicO group peptidase (beta-lactamase class C family)
MKNIALILCLFLCITCQNNTKEKSNSETKKTPAVVNEAFDQKMDSLYNLGVFNGYSATLVDSTGILYNQGFGYADKTNKKKYTEHTIINIASVSKMFIGIALLKAVEMKLLNLDDPINDHLPFEVVNPNHKDEIITVRHLATHTSSIVDTDIYMQTCYINKDDIAINEDLKRYELYYQNPPKDWVSLKDYLTKLLKKDEAFYNASTFSESEPGAVFEYTNIGAALCALIIEFAANKPFDKFTKEHIFNPLGMSSTSWNFEDVNMANYSKLYYDELELPYYKILSYPDGGLISSSTDLGKFLVDLIKGYDGNGAILNASSYKEIFKSQLKESAFGERKNYNVGIFTEKQIPYNVIGHSGGDPGTNTMLFFDTETKRGRVFIANTDSKKENSHEVMFGIWNAVNDF